MEINVYLIIGIFAIIIILIYLFTNKEGFRAPRRWLGFNNYHFHDHGLGSHIYQTDWTRGAFFQPFVPLDQGLYTSDEWSPRYIKHNQKHYASCRC